MAGRFNVDDYVDVQDRITKFWQENEDGAIRTFMMSDPDIFERVVFRAEVYKDRENERPDSIGWAAEEKGQGGMANSTSWHENCETSAIGRAFANMGYATDRKDRPSRQEMQKVERMSQEYDQAPAQQQSAPEQRQQQAPQQLRPQQQQNNYPPPQPGNHMTDKQANFIRQMAEGKGIDAQGLEEMSIEVFGKSFADFDRRDASAMIERLKSVNPA